MRKMSTTVILTVLVAVMIFGLLWGWRMLTHPAGNSSGSCVSKSVGTLTASEVQVRVLNAGSVRGRAGDIATVLSSKGFVVVSATNTSTTVSGTTIVGAGIDDPEVKLVAGFFPGAKTVADGRADHRVDVVVNDQFGGVDQNAATSVAVPGGTVCVPTGTAGASSSSGA